VRVLLEERGYLWQSAWGRSIAIRPYDRLVRLEVVFILFLVALMYLFYVPAPTVRAGTFVDSDITVDTTWALANSPYVIINNIAVRPGTTLAIEPGVTVKFAEGFSLRVEGNLSAVGTSSSVIRFTSNKVSPLPGDHGSIEFAGNPESSLVLSHVRVEFGTCGVKAIASGAGRYTIENSYFTDNSEAGICVFQESSPGSVIRGNVIVGNRLGVEASAPRLHQIVVTGNLLKNNTQGGIAINSRDSINDVRIDNNTILDSKGHGIALDSFLVEPWHLSEIYNVTISGNLISNATLSGVHVSSLSHYAAIDRMNVTNNTVRDIEGNGIELHSAPTAYGDSDLYNVTLFGNVISQATQSCISVQSAEGLHHSSISRNTVSACGEAGLLVSGKMGSPLSTLVSENRAYASSMGIVVRGIVANVTRNSVGYNSEIGVLISGSRGNLANYNDIYFNGFGMNVSDGATVNAQDNYWGDPSGPYQPSVNPSGKGNAVNGNGVDLDFVPWLMTSVQPINQRPVARLTASPNPVTTLERVTFSGAESSDDSSVSQYFFDFGDGSNSGWIPQPTIEHKYPSTAGTYSARLTVRDDTLLTSNNTAVVTVRVVWPPPPFYAEIFVDKASGEIPLTVTFSAYASNGVPPYAFTWDFGDGSTSTLQKPSHTYQVAGTFTVTLTVTDSDGHTVTDTVTITANSSLFPPWIIDLTVAVVAVGAVAGFLLYRRRAKREVPPASIPPPQGPPPQPPQT